MGIYIKDMKMPTNCFLCPLSVLNENRLFCEVTKNEVLRAKIDADCPLVPVPSYGRLIDADALYKEAFRQSEKEEGYYNCLDAVISAYDIANAPTIIPADHPKEKE